MRDAEEIAREVLDVTGSASEYFRTRDAVIDLIRARDAEMRAEVLNQRQAVDGDLYDPESLPPGTWRTAARVVSELGGPDRDCPNELHRDVMTQDPCQMCAYYRALRLIFAHATEMRLSWADTRAEEGLP